MSIIDPDALKEINLVDTEFNHVPGERLPEVRCLVVKEYRSKQVRRFWQDELYRMPAPPYSIGSDSLFVAFAAQAELSCHLALSWPFPARVLDLWVEFRAWSNGLLPTGSGDSLLAVLEHFHLSGIDAYEKTEMRSLAMRGGVYTADEKTAVLDYCESDVLALEKLLPRLYPCFA